jgi:hypothetical protein
LHDGFLYDAVQDEQMMAVVHYSHWKRSSSYTSGHAPALLFQSSMIGQSFRSSPARRLNLGGVVIDSVASYMSLAMTRDQYTDAWTYIGRSLPSLPLPRLLEFRLCSRQARPGRYRGRVGTRSSVLSNVHEMSSVAFEPQSRIS